MVPGRSAVEPLGGTAARSQLAASPKRGTSLDAGRMPAGELRWTRWLHLPDRDPGGASGVATEPSGDTLTLPGPPPHRGGTTGWDRAGCRQPGLDPFARRCSRAEARSPRRDPASNRRAALRRCRQPLPRRSEVGAATLAQHQLSDRDDRALGGRRTEVRPPLRGPAVAPSGGTVAGALGLCLAEARHGPRGLLGCRLLSEPRQLCRPRPPGRSPLTASGFAAVPTGDTRVGTRGIRPAETGPPPWDRLGHSSTREPRHLLRRQPRGRSPSTTSGSAAEPLATLRAAPSASTSPKRGLRLGAGSGASSSFRAPAASPSAAPGPKPVDRFRVRRRTLGRHASRRPRLPPRRSETSAVGPARVPAHLGAPAASPWAAPGPKPVDRFRVRRRTLGRHSNRALGFRLAGAGLSPWGRLGYQLLAEPRQRLRRQPPDRSPSAASGSTAEPSGDTPDRPARPPRRSDASAWVWPERQSSNPGSSPSAPCRPKPAPVRRGTLPNRRATPRLVPVVFRLAGARPGPPAPEGRQSGHLVSRAASVLRTEVRSPLAV
jgi:hypothetical protein